MSKSLINRRIVLPKHFNASSVVTFINNSEIIFKLIDKKEKGFLLDLSKVEKASMLGALVLYKIIEYSITRNCFEQPMILFDPKSTIAQALERYGFTELILAYMADKDKTLKEYKSLKISIGDNFIIAPQVLLRGDRKSREDINRIYLPKIEDYYANNQKTVSMILLTFSEILLNFWEHAKEDTKSIIVASGNKDQIEIACADTGEGIVSTLTNNVKHLYLKSQPKKALIKSVEKGATSKENTSHMGYGLWILDQITTLTKGRLHIYSQGAYFYNEYGRKSVGDCGYWQGTIIYLSLPLKNPKTLEDISEINMGKNLEINWG